MKRIHCWLIFSAMVGMVGCQEPVEKKIEDPNDNTEHMHVSEVDDAHSFARPDEAAVTHLNLTIDVDFEKKIISGITRYTIENKKGVDKIILDTKGLNIIKATLDDSDADTPFELGQTVEHLGEPLAITITPETKFINIHFETQPGAEALQWLDPQQTAGKKLPFLFTQSQAILARTWLPCQDGPGMRCSYEAVVTVPKEMMAVMSAENPTTKDEAGRGVYHFTMKQPIPSYLMALAVGDLAFESVGERTGVYAEPSMLEKSVYEFGEMEAMLLAAEALYGPYAWERYDLIVLPPSFPFGGMENPRLTFATPTILAGDRSLTALVAHELAHSWSGNLVTNATWDDFWLNEGFTVYFERRIMEAINGKDYADMLAILGHQDLLADVQEIGPKNADTHLKLDLEGRNPDDGMTNIAYEKGYFFLRTIEETVGREKMDAFLKGYFTENAFKVMNTEGFVALLKKDLLNNDAKLIAQIDIDAWVYGPGIPANCAKVESDRFEKVDAAIATWQGGTPAADLTASDWSTHEWLHFLRNLPSELSVEQLAELDAAFGFTASGNSEILAAWFQPAIRNNYAAADAKVEEFLVSVGRRKFLTPTYKALIEVDPTKEKARAIYKKARPNYHSVSTQTMDELLDWEG